jgi:hypothetical protein
MIKSFLDLSLDEIHNLPDNELIHICNNHGLLDLVTIERNVKLEPKLITESMDKLNLICGKLRRMCPSKYFKSCPPKYQYDENS